MRAGDESQRVLSRGGKKEPDSYLLHGGRGEGKGRRRESLLSGGIQKLLLSSVPGGCWPGAETSLINSSRERAAAAPVTNYT